MLEVNATTAGYGDLIILREINLTVASGELVALVGSNGAGKTTLLRTISGLLQPKGGTITFMGRRIDGVPPHDIVRAGLAQVPEGRRLFPEMSVLENLEMGAFTRNPSETKSSMAWVFELLPVLKDRQGQRAGTLSGGEQQMLSIGRALMTRPQLLMLDEPSLGLGPLVVQRVLETIETISRQGMAILLVEQNVSHALRLASRAYVLENGAITMTGTGEEILSNDHVRRAYLGL